MKYYHYISQNKLEMLFPQVDKGIIGNIISYFGSFELSFATAKIAFGSSANPKGAELQKKLDSVVLEVESNDQVGTIGDPKEYFRGEVYSRFLIYENTALYIGYDPDSDTVVLLGGSENNLVMNHGVAAQNHRSDYYYILRALRYSLGDEPFSGGINDLTFCHELANRYFGIREWKNSKIDWNKWLAEFVSHAMNDAFAMKIEFFAKKLTIYERQDRGGSIIVVGTPLYVIQE